MHHQMYRTANDGFRGEKLYDNRNSLKAPTLHTKFPDHANSSVQAPAKEYKNVWDTSMFYPAAINARARGEYIPIDAVS